MAGSVGWAGGLRGTRLRAKGDWAPREANTRDSGRLELLAILYTLRALAPHIRDCNLRYVCDNAKAQAYLRNGGGRDPRCSAITAEIFEWATRARVTILPPDSKRFYTGRDLTFADAWSRHRDNTSWTTSAALRETLTRNFGAPAIDLFADRVNHAAPVWYSRYPQPGSAGTDAMAQTWQPGPLHLAVPPFAMIPRVLEKAANDGATVLLLAPHWTGAPWWPMLDYQTRRRLLFKNIGASFDPSRTASPEPLLRGVASMGAYLIGPTPT